MAETEDKALLEEGNRLIDSVGIDVLCTLLKRLVSYKYQATISELVKEDIYNPELYEKQKHFKQVFELKHIKHYKDQVDALEEGSVETFDIVFLKKLIRTEVVSGYIVSEERWKDIQSCVEDNSDKDIDEIDKDIDEIDKDIDEMWHSSTTPDNIWINGLVKGSKVAGLVCILDYWRDELAHRKVPEAYKAGEIQAMRTNIEAAVWSLAGMLKISDEELFKDQKSHCMKMEPDKIYKYVRDSPKQEFNLEGALPGNDLELDFQADYLMPMVFTAKKLKQTGLHMDNQKPTQEQARIQDETVTYEDVDYENGFDKVIEELVNGKRVVLCEGDAGMGKTISCKRIMSSYYNSESDFVNKLKNVRQFNLVFYIPVRHIDTKAKLIDVICCKKNGMGYTKPYMRETVSHILQDPETGSKVLILLDGVDEREIPEGEDLYKLMTGEIYPHVKLMINTRPEAKILTKLRDFDPDLKIQLKGTSDDGIKEYLRKVENMLRRCKENMVDYSILHVPLYLTLIRYIFEEYVESDNSISNFDVPNSMTELFNAFLLLLVRKWLERLLRQDDASGLTFDKNPLDCRSTIPADIKRILVCFAAMSYHCLLADVYEFSSDHLQKYLVTPEELKTSGFFAVSDVDGRSYFTHKQFQEYFAALHIAHMEQDNFSFQQRIKEATNVKDKKTLREIFQKLEMTMKFVFGLNPAFSARLLQDITKHTSIPHNKRHRLPPDIEFELKLCFESCSPEVYQAMADLLLSANLKDQPLLDKPPSSSEVKSMMKIAEKLQPNERELLIEKWFDIKVELRTKPESSVIVLNINRITHILFSLMASFVIDEIRELKVMYSEISDISWLCGVFPDLASVEITFFEKEGVADQILKESLAPSVLQRTSDGSSIKHISIGLPVSAVVLVSLRKLRNLKSLRISSVSPSESMNIENIIQILSHTTSITQLTVSRLSAGVDTKTLNLLAEAISKLKYLKHLDLVGVCVEDADLNILFKYLNQWKHIESLGLGLEEIEQIEEHNLIASSLRSCRHIKAFIVHYHYYKGTKIEELTITSTIQSVCRMINSLRPDLKLWKMTNGVKDEICLEMKLHYD